MTVTMKKLDDEEDEDDDSIRRRTGYDDSTYSPDPEAYVQEVVRVRFSLKDFRIKVALRRKRGGSDADNTYTTLSLHHYIKHGLHIALQEQVARPRSAPFSSFCSMSASGSYGDPLGPKLRRRV